jgi:hypothetical protein
MKHIVIGGPRTGKSTYARMLRAQGIKTYCTDPKSLVKEPEDDVEYLPEGLDWSEGSQYVADNWLDKENVCIEGVATVRALRKYIDKHSGLPKGANVVTLDRQHGEPTKGQVSMKKGVDKIWKEIEPKTRPKLI